LGLTNKVPFAKSVLTIGLGPIVFAWADVAIIKKPPIHPATENKKFFFIIPPYIK